MENLEEIAPSSIARQASACARNTGSSYIVYVERSHLYWFGGGGGGVQPEGRLCIVFVSHCMLALYNKCCVVV